MPLSDSPSLRALGPRRLLRDKGAPVRRKRRALSTQGPLPRAAAAFARRNRRQDPADALTVAESSDAGARAAAVASASEATAAPRVRAESGSGDPLTTAATAAALVSATGNTARPATRWWFQRAADVRACSSAWCPRYTRKSTLLIKLAPSLAGQLGAAQPWRRARRG
jgi:hypothetical protein